MAGAFNLTAQINLQGPGNVKPVIGKIRRELGSIKTNVNLNLNKNSAKAVGDVTNRLRAMNNVLTTSRNHVADLNKAFRDLSASLSAVKSDSRIVSSGIGNISKGAATSAQQIKEAANAMESFGKQSYLAIKRFAAFSLVTSGVYGLVNAIQSGFKAFIELDRQLIRLQQTTNSGALGIKSLSDEITNLASSLGVSSASLAEVAVTLAQAGLTANQTKEALAAIAKTDLAPSFTNMTQTTEGVIAAFRQFNLETSDLESVLGSINAVAAGFAVEADDIIAAIQRTGGVFASASQGVSEGKDALNEFIAVFTSVRATTRESAETIATGLRTIFTRIQRESTIKALEELGIKLRDNEEQFVGAFEAVRRLSNGLRSIDPRSKEFAAISEELGGFRQIGKVIPLIQQFGTAQQALDVARKGSNSLTEAQAIAQQSLAVQIAKVREEFLGLIKTVGQSSSFKTFFSLVTKLTSGLIKLAATFKPILPLLAILGTLKVGKAAVDFGAGFTKAFKGGGGSASAGTSLGETLTGTKSREAETVKAAAAEATRNNTTAITSLTTSVTTLINSVNNLAEEIATSPGFTGKNGGGKILAFARGGVVPGSGNRDTVPAMLQPGEFVIRKKAVDTIGADKLHGMNKYAKGGFVRKYAEAGEVKSLNIPEQMKILRGIFDDLPQEQFGETTFTSNNLLAGVRRTFTPKSLLSGKIATVAKDSGLDAERLQQFRDKIKGTQEANKQQQEKNKAKILQEKSDLIKSGNILKFGLAGLRYGTTATGEWSGDVPVSAQGFEAIRSTNNQVPVQILTGAISKDLNERFAKNLEDSILQDFYSSVTTNAKKLSAVIGSDIVQDDNEIKKRIDNAGISGVIGAALEAMISLMGTPFVEKDEKSKSIDFPKGLGNKVAKIFNLPGNIPTDVTRSIGNPGKGIPEYIKQIGRFLENEIGSKIDKPSAAQTFATGGSVQDNVPALLTPGEFVINKKAASRIGYGRLNQLNKADKIQGFNKGGYVQRFADGSTVLPVSGPLLPGNRQLPDDPAGAKARDKALEILTNAAERAGKSLSQLEKDTKKQILALAQAKKTERISTRESLKTLTLQSTGRGFADQGARERYEATTRQQLTDLSAGRYSEEQISAAASAAADMAASGSTFSEIMNSTNPALEAFKAGMDSSKDSITALTEAQLEVADSLGALTEAARATADEFSNAEYVASGQAQRTLGLAGKISPTTAQGLEGSNALSSARSILGGGVLGNKLVAAIGALPEGISKPLQSAIDNIGGPSGAIAAGIGMIGQTLPGALKKIGLGGSVLGAGIAGALEEGGSRAVSMATLGTQLAGPLGGAIGLITGALSGAIDGFINAARTKKLEQSMAALDKSTTEASNALEKLSNVDNDKNLVAAAKATDTLRDSIKDLGTQAATGGTSVLGGAVSGAGYGAIAGLFIGSFLGPLGAAIGAGIGAAAGAVIGGITSVFSSDAISEEAFKGQLKAIETYITGLQQLAERRINLQSLETLDRTLAAFENANTPEQRAALAAQGSIVAEAQRAALLRESIQIGANEDVGTFLRSARGTTRGESGQRATEIAENTKLEVARSYAIQELNRQYAGNKELIDREIADKEKLTKRGLELIAVEEERIATQARLDAILREVNNQTETLIEKFRKMDAIINKFNDSLEMTEMMIDSAIAAAAGQATSTIQFNAGQKILANPTAASDADFNRVLNTIERLAGGGENAEQLSQTIRAQRMVELNLPELLRTATTENVDEVVEKIEDLFKAGGVSGTALENAVKQVRDSLSAQKEGRQSKGFSELLEEFPALASAMRSFDVAVQTGTNLLNNNSKTLSQYGNVLDQINNSLRNQIDIEEKADRIRLEYADKIAQVTGTISNLRLDEPVRNKVTALTRGAGIGETLDPRAIGEALRAAISRRADIQNQLRTPGQEGNVALQQQYAEQTNIVNNLNKALQELADNTESTAQTMKEFEKLDKILTTTYDFGRKLLTSGPDDLAQLAREQNSLNRFLTDPKYAEQIASDPRRFQERQEVFSGFDAIRGMFDPATAQELERQIIDQMMPQLKNMKIGDKTVGQIRDEAKQKAKDLEQQEKDRIAALQEIAANEKLLQDQLKTTGDGLISALGSLTTELQNGINIRQPGTSAAASGGAGLPDSGNLVPTYSNNPLLQGMMERLAQLNEYKTSTSSKGAFEFVDKKQIVALRQAIELFEGRYGDNRDISTFGTNEFDAFRRQVNLLAQAVEQKINENPPATPPTPTPTATTQPPSTSTTPTTTPTTTTTQPTPLVAGPTLPPSALIRSLNVGEPVNTQTVLQSLLTGINEGNPLPVKVINIAELRNVAGNPGENQQPYNMFATNEAKAFLADFTNSISSFKSYVDSLQKIMNLPVKIDVVGRHTVDVRITGAAAFESLKGDFTNLIMNEIDKKFQQIWARSGGQLGSSGASARSVQPQQF